MEGAGRRDTHKVGGSRGRVRQGLVLVAGRSSTKASSCCLCVVCVVCVVGGWAGCHVVFCSSIECGWIVSDGGVLGRVPWPCGLGPQSLPLWYLGREGKEPFEWGWRSGHSGVVAGVVVCCECGGEGGGGTSVSLKLETVKTEPGLGSTSLAREDSGRDAMNETEERGLASWPYT